MDKIEIIIPSKHNGISVKEYLKANNVGRGKIEYIRVNKHCFINDVCVSLETILKQGDRLAFIIDETIDFIAENVSLDVVYEDDYILIVNKPSNMIIHPDDKSKGNTLVNLIANYYKNNNINRKIRYIHRIDKETTGLVLFAKDFLTEAILLKNLQDDLIDRYYLALIEGKLKTKKGKIEASIGKDRHVNNKMCVSPNGKNAITYYEVINENDIFSLVKFKLLTGRTHQIRVHCNYINHPLLGDVLYGGDYRFIDRVALHSAIIEFTHPYTNKKISISLDVPSDMKIK